MKNPSGKRFEQVRQFYDQLADQFSQTRRYWWSGFEFLDKYFQHLPPGDKILDFGCGNGRLIEYLKKWKVEKDCYLGVDISERLIGHARKKYPLFRFEPIGEETKLPLTDRSVGLVVSIAVFHHLDTKMAEIALKEIGRVLKDNGQLILTVWNLWDEKYLPYLDRSDPEQPQGLVPFSSSGKTGQRYCYWWTVDSLEILLTKNGWNTVEKGYTFDKNQNPRNIFFVAKKIDQKQEFVDN